MPIKAAEYQEFAIGFQHICNTSPVFYLVTNNGRQMTMTQAKEGTLTCNNTQIRYVESGKGDPVVIYPANASQPFDELAIDLAADHRVIRLKVQMSDRGTSQLTAEVLAQALAQLNVSSYSVVGVGNGALPALTLALSAPDQVQKLVLLSPTIASVQASLVNAKLKDIKAPTLVLVGTRDRSGARETGRLCREHIPTCHLLLVYDAGQTLVADRREACLSPIREFLTQGEGFIVTHESQMIRP